MAEVSSATVAAVVAESGREAAAGDPSESASSNLKRQREDESTGTGEEGPDDVKAKRQAADGVLGGAERAEKKNLPAEEAAGVCAANNNVNGTNENVINHRKSDDDETGGMVGGPLSNLRVSKLQAVVYPQLLLEELPPSAAAVQTVLSSRKEAQRILSAEDDRLIVVVGPCSIHDVAAAMDYARLLQPVAVRLRDDLKIVMRVYFEKPRTTVGWKGLINDPAIDGSFNINLGLRLARKLLCDINALGLPVGCEFLDTMSPQYLSDLVSWGAIGARTTECQLHRELASVLSMPVGFKNATSGDVDVAVDACRSAVNPHCFLGITTQGSAAVVHSKGNEFVHVILRGGKAGTNFDAESVASCLKKLREAKLRESIVIDCSHGNSLKDHKRQPIVAKDICQQLADGQKAITGVMLESHIHEGNQSVPDEEKLSQHAVSPSDHPADATAGTTVTRDSTNGYITNFRPKALELLKYGVSVTDKCLCWEDTAEVLEELAAGVRRRREVTNR